MRGNTITAGSAFATNAHDEIWRTAAQAGSGEDTAGLHLTFRKYRFVRPSSMGRPLAAVGVSPAASRAKAASWMVK